jgi:hypothetical protein
LYVSRGHSTRVWMIRASSEDSPDGEVAMLQP